MKKRFAVLVFTVLFAISAFAQSARHRAVRSAEPTSAGLIDAALAAGKIDTETALQYHVFAAFGDCRLPAQFHGDDSATDNTYVLDQLDATFRSLSPAAQATLRPYLLQPFASGGWVEAQQAACGASKITPSDFHPKDIRILDGRVDVNYLPGDEGAAGRIANDASFIYPALAQLMGEPLPYDPSLKDPLHLEIYVVSGRGGFKGAAGELPDNEDCNHSPAFVEISDTASKENLVSCIMIAILEGYSVATECKFPEYEWLLRATAVWAIDYVYPTNNHEHGVAPAFVSRPDLPLEHNDGFGDSHPEGAYLLPFYVARRFHDPEFVHSMWLAAKTKKSLEAVDDALAPEGGFKEQWPEFAVYNFNYQPPYNQYQQWDDLTAQARSDSNSLAATPDSKSEMSPSLQPLAARYFHYFIDNSVRSLAFINGLNYKLRFRNWVTPELGPLYVLDNQPPPQGLKIQALLKINGVWETTPRDWTQRPYIGFCREVASDHVDEMEIIYTNSEYHNRQPIEAQSLAPLVWVSNMGCSQWKTIEASFQENDGFLPLKVTWTATFKRVLDSLDPGPTPTLPADGTAVGLLLYQGSGTAAWDINGSIGDCHFSGSGTLPLDVTLLQTWNFAPPEAILNRVYGVTIATLQPINFSANCGSTQTALPSLAITPPAELKRVLADGVTIQDTHSMLLDLRGKASWTIKSSPP